jgi:6-phosphofructokinase
MNDKDTEMQNSGCTLCANCGEQEHKTEACREELVENVELQAISSLLVIGGRSSDAAAANAHSTRNTTVQRYAFTAKKAT